MDFEPAVRELLSNLPDAIAIYVFGSAAKGEERADSDVDLAVLGRSPLAPLRRWDLQARLASVLHRSVDLVDLRSASTVMRVQVIDGGRLIYDGAPGDRALFEATALSSYARLQEERKGILEDIRARGTVYG